jgi:hypothetical protein
MIFSLICATHSTHLIFRDLMTQIIFGEEFKLLNSFLNFFLHVVRVTIECDKRRRHISIRRRPACMSAERQQQDKQKDMRQLIACSNGMN